MLSEASPDADDRASSEQESPPTISTLKLAGHVIDAAHASLSAANLASEYGEGQGARRCGSSGERTTHLVPSPSSRPRSRSPATSASCLRLGIESGCFEDLLQGMLTVRGGGFAIREAGLRGRRIALILAGAGRTTPAEPPKSSSTAIGPAASSRRDSPVDSRHRSHRNDILIADRLLKLDGGELPVELPPGLSAAVEAASRRFAQPTRRDAASTGGVHRGAC